jgi:hypothetical protein
MSSKTVLEQVGSGVLSRTLEEGYGPGAWHGSDLKAASARASQRRRDCAASRLLRA